MPEDIPIEWRDRLKSVEGSCKETNTVLKEIKNEITEIKTALTGSMEDNRRGLFMRMQIVEGWKSLISWSLGVLYIAFVGTVIGVLVNKL